MKAGKSGRKGTGAGNRNGEEREREREGERATLVTKMKQDGARWRSEKEVRFNRIIAPRPNGS